MTRKFYDDDSETHFLIKKKNKEELKSGSISSSSSSSSSSSIKYGIQVDHEMSAQEEGEEQQQLILLKSILIKQTELCNQTSIMLRLLVQRSVNYELCHQHHLHEHSTTNNTSESVIVNENNIVSKNENNWFNYLLIKVMSIFKWKWFQ